MNTATGFKVQGLGSCEGKMGSKCYCRIEGRILKRNAWRVRRT